jgi:hypothetical protein
VLTSFLAAAKKGGMIIAQTFADSLLRDSAVRRGRLGPKAKSDRRCDASGLRRMRARKAGNRNPVALTPYLGKFFTVSRKATLFM